MENNEQNTQEASKPEEILTEVTSVAEQELKTGKKIEIDADDLVTNAKRTFIPIKRHFMSIYGNMSGRGRERVISALLDLPMDNLRVLLKGKEEIEAYKLGQQVLWCRQLILTDAIKKEKMRIEQMKASATTGNEGETKVEENNNAQETKESTNE